MIKSIHDIAQSILHNYSWLNLFMTLSLSCYIIPSNHITIYLIGLIFILDPNLTKYNWWIDNPSEILHRAGQYYWNALQNFQGIPPQKEVWWTNEILWNYCLSWQIIQKFYTKHGSILCAKFRRDSSTKTDPVDQNMMLQNLFPIYFVQTGSIC